MTVQEFYEQLDRLEFDTGKKWVKQRTDVRLTVAIKPAPDNTEFWACEILEVDDRHVIGEGSGDTHYAAMEAALSNLSKDADHWGFRFRQPKKKAS